MARPAASLPRAFPVFLALFARHRAVSAPARNSSEASRDELELELDRNAPKGPILFRRILVSPPARRPHGRRCAVSSTGVGA